MKNDDQKALTFRMPCEMWQFLRKYGFDREMSAGAAVRLIVSEFIKKDQANAKTKQA